MADEKYSLESYSPESTISQILIGNNSAFSITDANTRTTVGELCKAVNDLDAKTNNLDTKTANLKSIEAATVGTGVSASFGDGTTQNSYTLGFKTDTFLYGYSSYQKEDES